MMHILKYILIGFLFVLLVPVQIFSQTVEQNLEKYWYYRQRLEDHFIVISDGNEKGTNIPAMAVSHENGKMNWNDGNSGMQYYIGMLATEYRILKDQGLDYQKTLQKLDYAIKAVERLDYTAETYWGGEACSNGFFIRDDIYAGFGEWAYNSGKNTNFKNRPMFSTLTDPEKGQPAKDNSQDNIWHYFLNFALVVKMVDEPDIRARVQKLACDMVIHMHSYCKNFSVLPTRKEIGYNSSNKSWFVYQDDTYENSTFEPGWIIRNPVTHHEATEGYMIYEYEPYHIGRQWGFAEAARWINDGVAYNTEGKYLHYNGSESEKIIMDLLVEESVTAENIASWINLIPIPDLFDIIDEKVLLEELQSNMTSQDYSFKVLYTVIGSHWEYLKSKLNLHNPHHEHLVLIYELLHGNTDIKEDLNYRNMYENLLNLAPDCGPYLYYNYDRPFIYPPRWGFMNRLDSDPEDPDGNPPCPNLPVIPGDFNGIDYMLLHNLYWLVYNNVQTENSNYPLSTGYGNKDNPAIVKAAIIKSNKQIQSDAKVTYEAETKVILEKGFHAYLGASFIAKAIGTVPVYQNSKSFVPECSNRSWIASSQKSAPTVLQIEESSPHETNFNVYPNPSSGVFTIGFLNELPSSIEIIDVAGNIVLSESQITQDKLTVNLSERSKGIYVVRMIFDNEIKTTRLILD